MLTSYFVIYCDVAMIH